MTDKELNRGLKREGIHAAAVVALFALAIGAVAWFWSTRQPQEIVLVNGAIGVSIAVFVTAAIAYVRNMDLSDVLEMLLAAVTGVFALIGAILKGIWSAICGLFGWD